MNRRTVPFTAAVTLTRPEPAPYIDKNGIEQEAAANQPRFNYDEGHPEGLLLDSLLTEHAALVPDPAFNEEAGTWVFTGALENCRPLPGSGFDELLTGNGTLVFVYEGGAGKCWAAGQVLYTVDPITPAMATAITAGGYARAAFHEYKPFAISDTEAAQLATGAFEIVTPPALLADLEEQEYGTRDEAGAFQRKPYTGIFDLTRPGPTTVWDAQGNLVTVPSGEPAFDHDPVTGAPLGQQIVAFPVTNTLAYSEDLVGYDTSGATVQNVSAPNPSGGTTVSRLIEDTTDGPHLISMGAPPDGASYAHFLVAPAGRRFFYFQLAFGGIKRGCVVDTETGDTATISQAGANFSVSDVSVKVLRDGYVLVRATLLKSSDCRLVIGTATALGVDGQNTPSHVGDGESGINLWGLQISTTPNAPYIPTDGTAATRPADIDYCAEPFAERYNPERGSLFFEWDAQHADWIFQANAGTNNNYNSVIFHQQSGGQIVVIPGSDPMSIPTNKTMEGHHKGLLSWEAGELQIYFDGVAIYSGEKLMPAGLSIARFFLRSNGGNPSAGLKKQFWLSDQPVTEARGMELTTL